MHGFADPVGHATGWKAESNIIEPLEQIGADVVSTVFVANDRDDCHPVEGHHATFGIGLPKERVQPLEDSLGMARRVTHPDRCAQYENVGIENLLANSGPLVAVPLI